MREVQNIKIDSIIVHILVPKIEGLVISDAPINLESNRPAVSFLRNHIQNVHKDNNLRAAKFVGFEENTPSKICNDLLEHPGNLVGASKLLGQQLYSIMERDARISSCDFIVCLYHEDNQDSQPYLALLKLDPSSAFRNKIERIEGRNIVSLEMMDLVFTSERVQKAALIRSILPDNAYDLLLLDRQVSKEKGPEIAEFFRKTFLNCELAYDSTLLTRELYKALNFTENMLREQKFYNEASIFTDFLKPTFYEDEFHLNKWINTLPFPSEIREIVSDSVSSNLHDINFEIDKNISKKFYKKIRYEGDNGLIIEINEANKDEISAKPVAGTPLKPAHWEISVETQKWVRVK